MRWIWLWCLLPLCILAQAQTQRGLKGDYDTKEYPKVSFVWNSAYPDVLDRSQFVLTENGKDVDFSLAVLPKGDSVQSPKSILFLWEDMASHKEQLKFSRNLLKSFFEETALNKSDRFNIAVFNRKKDSEEVLHALLTDFVGNSGVLSNAVQTYKSKNESFKEFPLQSDLYLAVNKGVELLKKQPSDRLGIIVVITAGLNIKAAGASTEMETVRKNAQEAGIPIYVAKYPLFGDTPEINVLAESTYGLSVNSLDARAALGELQRFYRDFNSRCYGQDYKLSFTTTAERDGKSHPIHLAINKVPQQILPFTAPAMTFGWWLEENRWLAISLAVAIVLLVVLLIWLVRRRSMERDRQVARNRAEQQAQIEELKNQQKEEKQKYAAENERRKEEEIRRAREEEAEHLLRLMQTKNLFPRMQCVVGSHSFIYDINSIHTTIGREKDNDLVLDNDTISRHHAELNFTGGGFEIVDKKSSNKVIVNGHFVERAILKNGDKIGLGSVIITFYV